MTYRISRFTLFALFLTASCSLSQATDVRATGEGSKVLFIGNSYLYYNDIPDIAQALADSAKGEKLAIAVIASPDLALLDHWNAGTARGAIAKGGWKWVVLQQGPSSVEANRDELRTITKLFTAEIARAGGTTAFFSAWPAQNRTQDFVRSIESYTLAASDVNGLLVPVAAAWQAALNRDPTVQLYADGLHPSLDGAYLSALVVYSKLLGKDPRSAALQFRTRLGRSISISPARGALLQAAAAEVTGYLK